MTETKRGKNVAIVGTILQLVFTAAMLTMWLLTKSLAAMVCTWALAGGVLLWLMAAVLFYCRQLAAQEEIELAEIAARGETGTIFEGEQGVAMRVAAGRLAAMERWAVPIFAVLWACGHAVVGALTIRYLAALDKPLALTGVAPAALFAVLIAFMAFLFSRYCTGLGTERPWLLLRATGSYLLVNVLLIAAVLVALLAASQKYASADRIIAYLSPAVQLLLAAEVVLNVLLDLYRPRVGGQEDRPPFDSRLFNLVAQPGRVGHTIAETLNYQFGFEVSKTWFYQLLGRAFVPLIVLGIVVMFLMSTIVMVPEGSQAIVFHFGVPSAETVKPGIWLKWPWPIDRVEMFDTGQVYEIVLGEGEERTEKERAASYVNGRRLFLWTEEHGDRKELDFLVAGPKRGPGDTAKEDATGRKEAKALPSVDVIKLVVPVQYRITDAFKYGYKSRDSHALLEKVAYQKMVQYCASATLTSSKGDPDSDRPEAIMTHGRAKAARKLKDHIQKAVGPGPDGLDLGVEITYVGLVSVHPPADVAPEYQKVLEAERAQDEKRYEAQGQANKLLARVAGTPGDARKLAQAIRVLDSLEELSRQRNEPAKRQAMLSSKVSEVRNILASVDKEIERDRILGRQPAVLLEYRKELREHLSLLDAVRDSPVTFDYAGRIVEAQKLVDNRFDNAIGQPAEQVAKARAYRWAKEMTEEGRLVAFRAQWEAYRNNPKVYRINRWLKVWDMALPGIPKYVLAADRERIEIRLNLEKHVDPMAGAMSGEDTDQ